MITKSLKLLLIISSVTMMSYAEESKNYTYGKKEKTLDKNRYKNISPECKEILVSGIVEIKNKNLDYDQNKVFFKHQRITYVIPDRDSKKIKNCIRERSTGINEINMNKMLLKID